MWDYCAQAIHAALSGKDTQLVFWHKFLCQSLGIAKETALNSAAQRQIVAGGEDCFFGPAPGRLGWCDLMPKAWLVLCVRH